MIAAGVIDSNELGVRITAVETGAAFDDVHGAIRTDFDIDRADESEAGEKRANLEHIATLVQFHFFDVIAGPFSNKKCLVEISRELLAVHHVRIEVIDGAAHGSASAAAVQFWKLGRTIIRIPKPGG